MFTAIDIDDAGTLYACDDETDSLCAIAAGVRTVATLVSGGGYQSVSENKGILALCSQEAEKVILCETSGMAIGEFAEVEPSRGFSARMVLVWASALYLVALALVFAVRKTRRLAKEGASAKIGPLFLSAAVMLAIGLVIGNLSYSSYQESLRLRSNEINVGADYLHNAAVDMSAALEKASNRDALHLPLRQGAVRALCRYLLPMASNTHEGPGFLLDRERRADVTGIAQPVEHRAHRGSVHARPRYGLQGDMENMANYIHISS